MDRETLMRMLAGAVASRIADAECNDPNCEVHGAKAAAEREANIKTANAAGYAAMQTLLDAASTAPVGKQAEVMLAAVGVMLGEVLVIQGVDHGERKASAKTAATFGRQLAELVDDDFLDADISDARIEDLISCRASMAPALEAMRVARRRWRAQSRAGSQ